MSRQMTASPKTRPLHIRLRPEQRRVIEQAAEASYKTLSDFVRDIALKEANRLLLEQTRFALSPEAWEAFNKALEAQPRDNPRLRELMSQKPVWEP